MSIGTFVQRQEDEADVDISPGVPLCVDLDGTLTLSDTLLEMFVILIKQRPWCVFLLPIWLLGGKAHFKAEMARHVEFDAADIPYQTALVEWLRHEHAAGRPVVLVSGANERTVDAVARHFGFFHETLASDAGRNMTGATKAAALVERYGCFDYVGDAAVDVAVWEAAREAILSAHSKRQASQLGKHIEFSRVFDAASVSRLKLWIRALRVHQWVKNVLMFVPIVLAHQIFDLGRLSTLVICFVAFNISASSVYILNDLLDLAADRQHPRKRLRPFASGDLPIIQGLIVWPVLVSVGFGLALYASPAFALVLVGYYALTLAYSFDLKRRPLVDVFALASLYTMRIVAGAAAASVELSPWLLGFSIFIFLSLAIVKRVAELHSVRERGLSDIAGRGYHLEDLAMLEMLGVAAGYASVVVLALYVSAPESRALYAHHQLLWLFAPLVLFWISRVWLITHRGEMHDDPIVFALKDAPSRIVGLVALLVLEIAAL